MNAIGYEIKIIKSPKDKSASPDLTKPYKDKAGNEYFHIEYLAPRKLIDGVKDRPQDRPYTTTVNNGIRDQKIMFADLLDTVALGENIGYTKGPSGLKLNPSEFGKIGNLVKKIVDAHYIIQPDGTRFQNSKGEDAIRRELYVFVPNGDNADIFFNREIARIPDEAWEVLKTQRINGSIKDTTD